MKSIDFATSSLSISALTSGVYGLTLCSSPPAVASTMCGPRASNTSRGAAMECVSSILSTYVAESHVMIGRNAVVLVKSMRRRQALRIDCRDATCRKWPLHSLRP